MTISATDRKLLWGNAGNRCAICKRKLVAPATTADAQALIGEEAHVVSRSEGGPRGGQLPRQQLDKYDNLMLLCPSCHTTIDKQVDTWPRDRLLDTKREHEEWIVAKLSDERGSEAIPPVRLIPKAEPKLEYILSGSQLWDTVVGAHRYYVNGIEDDDAPSELVDRVDSFLQSIIDYGEISDDIESNGRAAVRAAKRAMDLELKRLMLNGVVFVGGTRPVLLTGGVGNDQYWTDFFLSAFTEGHPVMQEYIRQLDDHLGSLSPEDRETAATSVAEQVARIVRTVELADAQAADAKTRSKP